MSDAFPHGRITNEPRDGITLIPKDGTDGLDLSLFASQDGKRLGLNITIHTEEGDYHLPLAGEQTELLRKSLAYINTLTVGDREQILNELRRQQGGHG